VHLTGGTLRVFKHFARLEVVSDKIALSRPAHQQVTPTVGRQSCKEEGKPYGFMAYRRRKTVAFSTMLCNM